MACLVITCLLGLILVVYLSLGKERPPNMQFQQRESFTGAVFSMSSTSSIVECLAVCMNHLPQCWAVRYTNVIKHCELLWHDKNQTPIMIVADVDRKIFRMVQLHQISAFIYNNVFRLLITKYGLPKHFSFLLSINSIYYHYSVNGYNSFNLTLCSH